MKKSFEETTRGYPDPDLPEGKGCAIFVIGFAVICTLAFIYWIYWILNIETWI